MPSEWLDNLENHIVKKVNEVANTEVKMRPDWFSESEYVLINLINKRNQVFKMFIKQLSEPKHQIPREARHQKLREKRKAKRQWPFTYAKRCKKADFAINLKEASSMVFKLMDGFQKHQWHFV
jgi:hypothetical protein